MTQTNLRTFERLSVLTVAERDAYVAVRLGDRGPREYQRERGYSSPGTVSNLLARAETKLGDGGAS